MAEAAEALGGVHFQAGEFDCVVFFEVFELLVGGLFALLVGGEEAGQAGKFGSVVFL